MKLYFLSLLYDKKKEDYYLEMNKSGLQGAINTFQWNLIDGLDIVLKKYGLKLNLINSLPFGTFPKHCKKVLFKSESWSHNGESYDRNIGFVNLLLLKQIGRIWSYKRLLNGLLKNDKDQIVIFTYDLYWPYLYVLSKLRKKYSKLIVVPIITDLPNEYGFKKVENKVMGFLRKIIGKKQLKIIQEFDKYILLTEYMKDPLEIKEKPCLVIEAISSSSEIHNWKNVKEHTILYAGTLNKEFGILDLIEAFELIKDERYKLIICGDGNARSVVESKAVLNPQIEYRGYCTKKEIYSLYEEIQILINPRKNIGEYTKYSFPSKTVEYLTSGRPFIGYKLDGIPKEYDEHIYYVDGDTVEDLKRTIVEVSEQTREQLENHAQKAYQFVMREKNPKIQAEKILKFVLNEEM